MWYKLNEDKTFTKVDSVLEQQGFGTESWKVGRDELEDGTLISTVFLGLDHSYSSKGGPILFETMIFAPEGKLKEYDQYQTRYKSWKQAKEAHDKIVELLKSKL